MKHVMRKTKIHESHRIGDISRNYNQKQIVDKKRDRRRVKMIKDKETNADIETYRQNGKQRDN